MTVTPEQLTEWERLAAEATSGPWAWEATGQQDNAWSLGLTEPAVSGEIVETEDGERPEVVEHVAESGAAESKADAAFIAASRTAVPALVEEVRMLREKARECPACEKLAHNIARAEAAEAEVVRWREVFVEVATSAEVFAVDSARILRAALEGSSK